MNPLKNLLTKALPSLAGAATQPHPYRPRSGWVEHRTAPEIHTQLQVAGWGQPRLHLAQHPAD